MNKKVLGVAMVLVFCITWWIVAGEAWGNVWKYSWYRSFWGPYWSHFRTQASWGVGAGLLADALLLVGVVAWQKITFKP